MDGPNKIEALLNEARRLAISHVETTARDILRKNRNFKYFMMGMGCVFFTIIGENGSEVDLDLDDREEFRSLLNFMNKWDSVLKITGEPMRFTADGPTVTSW